jgi:hypothetical protein
METGDVAKRTTTRVPPPPARGRRGIIAPVPQASNAPNNLSIPNSGLQDLNFKVDPIFHRMFKRVANTKDMSMKELLESAFNCWVEKFGDEEVQQAIEWARKKTDGPG